MLITTCAHCRSRFRVTPQQLNARQGQVRCGRCRGIFNGFQALERLPDDDTGARLLAQHEAALRREAQASGGAAAASAEDAAGSIPLEAPAAAAPGPGTPVHAPAAPKSREPEPPPRPASAREAAPPRASRTATWPPIAPPQAARRPPSRAWAFAAALMALVVALELAFAYRGALARRYPPLRPLLEAMCQPLRCAVPWPRDEALIRLEDSDMLEVPGKPGEIALGARIRNLASAAQEYPHLELTLTDVAGQAAARRVLRPPDYLGRPLAAGEVIAPGAEVQVQLQLSTPRLKPTGYQILVFYP